MRRGTALGAAPRRAWCLAFVELTAAEPEACEGVSRETSSHGGGVPGRLKMFHVKHSFGRFGAEKCFT